MILITLGTQDKSFERLLKAVDEQIEQGNIQDKVIVQAGYTSYTSKNMEVFDYIDREQFAELLKQANLIITHGGAGTIMTALKAGKKVIGAARLAKYGEHHNDHQTQILESFDEQGCLIYCEDLNELGKAIQKSETFVAQPIQSNTESFIELLENFIEKTK